MTRYVCPFGAALLRSPLRAPSGLRRDGEK